MSLKEKAIHGVKWTTAATIVLTLVQVLKLAVLTRLLEKSDFGLIAIATMIIGFTDIFSELGLTVAVIHKQGITDNQYSSIYWTNIFLGIVVFLVLCLLSPLLAFFYNEAILSRIVPLLGIQILFHGFGKMFQTIKAKKLEYDYISKVNIFSAVLGFFSTIIFAYVGWGIYSLVWGQLLQIATAQSIYAIEGWKMQRIGFHFNYGEISDFIKIGSYRLGSQILDFISSKIDVFLIGHFFGMSDLGVYNLGKDLMMKPYVMINSLINSVASSAFSQLQSNLDLLRQNYLKLLNIINTIAIPIYISIFIFANPIVEILYGKEYIEVALFLRLFTLVGIECAISSQGSILQVSLGRTDVGFKWTIIRIILSTGVILAASNFDIYIVAYGQLFVSLCSLFIFWYVAVNSVIRIPLNLYLGTLKTPLLVSMVSSIPILLIMKFLTIPIAALIILLFLFFLLCFLYYWKFKSDMVSFLVQSLKNKG